MTLRRKILYYSILVLLCLVLVAYALTNTIIINTLSNLESTYTTDSVNRVLSAIDDDINNLEITGTDWAMWDDTYEFIENPSQSYIEANLIDEMLIQLNLNFIVLANTSEQIIFAKALDLDEEKQIPLPIQHYLTPGSPLLTHTSPESITSAIILLRDNPVLVTSQPILTSKGEGPIRGTLIMGRYLNATAIRKLEDRTNTPIVIEPISVMKLPKDFWGRVNASSDENRVVVQPIDMTTVAGYAVIRDINNHPILVLRVDLPRDIYNQGFWNVFILLLGIICVFVLSSFGLFWIFDRQVLRRLTRIDNSVSRIGKTKGYQLLDSTTKDDDELTRLVNSINEMLNRLSESQTKIQQSEKEYHKLFNKSQQQYQEEKETRSKLEEEIQKRIEFTRALVHELKTPITPVLAAIELLQEEIHDERLLRLTRSIDRSANYLNKRIDELLDLARAETNRLDLNIVPVDITALLNDIGQMMTALALQNGQTMVIDVPSHLPIVSGDDGRLRQVVENLLINALKFTPAGGTITVKAREESDNVVVEIQDNGQGISEEDQKRIFEPYHRRIGDREHLSGLGLGLALSKRFIELHGGKIWVSSQPGKGSTFGFSLALGKVDDGKKQARPRNKS